MGTTNKSIRLKTIDLLNEVKADPDCLIWATPQTTDLPQWAIDMAVICTKAELDNTQHRLGWIYQPQYLPPDDFNDCSREIEPIISLWVDAVIKLNTGDFTNLREINWMAATSNWSQDVTEAIISCLQGDALKTKVLDCILDEWHYKDNGASLQADVFSPKYDDFCTNLKRYIANSDLYSIEAIRQQENERLTRLESRLEALADEQKAIASKVDAMTMPKEFTTPKAKAILQRAVEKELCEPDSRGGYRWLKDDRLWAWFVFRTSDKTCLDIRNAKGIKWQPYVTLFGMSDRKKKSATEYISQVNNNYASAPEGHETVDSLLEQV